MMKVILLVSTAALALTCGTLQANLLIDPSFEGSIVYDGPPAFGGWDGFSSTPGTLSGAGFGTVARRTGDQHALLSISATNHFAGIYQDVFIGAGSTVEFKIWHQDVSGSNGQGINMQLRYFDSINDVEIGQSPRATPSSLGSSYESFSIIDVVPQGADTVRAFYAINSYQGIANQLLYLDDAELNVIPEPSSVLLLTFSAGGILFYRRSKRCRRMIYRY